MGRKGEASPRFSREFKERAVELVLEAYEREGSTYAIIPPIADKLGISSRALHRWVRQVEVETGRRPGLGTAERDRLLALERENHELRRANEILKAASAFFAAELDRPGPR